MENKRLIVVGLVGIALLFGVGAVAVVLLGGSEGAALPERGPSAPRAEEARPPADAPIPRLVAPPAPEAPPAEAGAPAAVAPNVPREVFGPMRLTTAPLNRATAKERRDALRAARDQLTAGFAALRQQADACGAQGASFVLSLEAGDGVVRVESARVEERGPVPDGAVACARSALSGRVIPAPSFVPGRRWEVSL